jgi:TonB family protein
MGVECRVGGRSLLMRRFVGRIARSTMASRRIARSESSDALREPATAAMHLRRQSRTGTAAVCVVPGLAMGHECAKGEETSMHVGLRSFSAHHHPFLLLANGIVLLFFSLASRAAPRPEDDEQACLFDQPSDVAPKDAPPALCRYQAFGYIAPPPLYLCKDALSGAARPQRQTMGWTVLDRSVCRVSESRWLLRLVLHIIDCRDSHFVVADEYALDETASRTLSLLLPDSRGADDCVGLFRTPTTRFQTHCLHEMLDRVIAYRIDGLARPDRLPVGETWSFESDQILRPVTLTRLPTRYVEIIAVGDGPSAINEAVLKAMRLVAAEAPSVTGAERIGTTIVLPPANGPPPLWRKAVSVSVLRPALKRLDASPEYPRLALERHMEGTVRLRAKISTSGTVDDIRVLKGNAILASAVVEAVRRWRYIPVILNGISTATDLEIWCRFTLRSHQTR